MFFKSKSNIDNSDNDSIRLEFKYIYNKPITTYKLIDEYAKFILTFQFQLFIIALSMIYLLISLASFALDISEKDYHNHIVFDVALPHHLDIIKVSLSSIFLIELILRMLTTGVAEYIKCLWNILDLLIISLCLITEVIFMILDREDLEMFDGYMMGFRCWYIIRCLYKANSIKEQKETEYLITASEYLADSNQKLQLAIDNTKRLEAELNILYEIANDFESKAKNENDADIMERKKSWNSFVPSNLSIFMRPGIIKRTLSKGSGNSAVDLHNSNRSSLVRVNSFALPVKKLGDKNFKSEKSLKKRPVSELILAKSFVPDWIDEVEVVIPKNLQRFDIVSDSDRDVVDKKREKQKKDSDNDSSVTSGYSADKCLSLSTEEDYNDNTSCLYTESDY